MPALNYAVRLRASYEALATTCSDWAARCEKMLCYEHPDDPKNIHCHFLLVGVRDSTDTLKRDYKLHGLELKGPGQVSFKLSFKLKDGTNICITEATIPKYITYMSKGKYDPKYNKGYDPEILELYKKAWVDHPKQSREESLFDDFIVSLEPLTKTLPVGMTDMGFVLSDKIIRDKAFRFAIEKAKGIINVGTRKDAKMLYDSTRWKMGLVFLSDLVLPFEKV